MTKTTNIIVTILLVLLVSSAFAYWNANQLDAKVYHFIHQVDLSLYTHRGLVQHEPKEENLSLDEAIAYQDNRFENGERLAALAGYENLLKQDPSNMELLLRIGIIYLQEKEYSLASENLNSVYEFKESVFALDAAWFLALMQAEFGNLDQTQKLLKEVNK